MVDKENQHQQQQQQESSKSQKRKFDDEIGLQPEDEEYVDIKIFFLLLFIDSHSHVLYPLIRLNGNDDDDGSMLKFYCCFFLKIKTLLTFIQIR